LSSCQYFKGSAQNRKILILNSNANDKNIFQNLEDIRLKYYNYLNDINDLKIEIKSYNTIDKQTVILILIKEYNINCIYDNKKYKKEFSIKVKEASFEELSNFVKFI
jgi:hypothetical protein